MTDLKYNLLKMLYDASPIHPLKEIDLINSGLASPVKIDDAIDDLVSQDYIKASITSNSLKITSLGRIAYESEKETRDSNAQREATEYKHYRSNKILLILGLIIPSVLSLIGIAISVIQLFS